MTASPLARFILGVRHPHILDTVPRIEYIISRTQAQSYLEIGVRTGETFNSINLPYKVGVDPDFQFDWQSVHSGGSLLFQTTSDAFFADLNSSGPMAQEMKKNWPREDLKFDIIFIDGLHTFEQSLRDFENSLAYAHEDTIWILDDTVPSNPYSAWPDMDLSLKVRELSGISFLDWCGDVYKTLLAIHDNYPDFAYCTLMGFNPQTVLWRSSDKRKRKPAFSSLEEIGRQSYFDIFKYPELFIPVPDEEFPLLLNKPLHPDDYRSPALWESLIYLDLGELIPKEYLAPPDNKSE